MKNHAVIKICQKGESKGRIILTFIFVLVWQCYADWNGSIGALIQKTSCTCSGYNVIYECTVIGSHFGNTIWSGSAFNCSLEEIFLQHLLFPDNAHGECNNGSVIGKSIRVDNRTYYTSQLNVTISSDLIGKSIECFYDDNNGMKQLVGEKNITLTTDQFRPPNIMIEPANHTSDVVTFVWNQAINDSKCPALRYNLASNCGSCPNTTSHTTVTCTDVLTVGSTCTFAVWTVVCESITGDADEVHFNLTRTSEVLPIPSSLATFVTVCTVVFVVIGTITVVILLWLVIRRQRICVWVKSWGTKHSQSTRGQEMTDVCKVSCDNEDIDYTTLKIVDNENIGVYGLEDAYSKSPAVETSNLPIKDTNVLPLDLNSVLQRLPGQATSRWYSFGLEFGIPKHILEELKEYPESQCLIEVLDYWLRYHPGQPHWHEVAEVQKKVNARSTRTDSTGHT